VERFENRKRCSPYTHSVNPKRLLARLVAGHLRNVSFRDLSSRGVVKDYHINIFFSDEDDGYIADIPDLEACSAFGTSAEAALAEVERAKDAWVAAAREAGKPIPEPRSVRSSIRRDSENRRCRGVRPHG
jgi:predicted RNase H-like HicB family nuclease